MTLQSIRMVDLEWIHDHKGEPRLILIDVRTSLPDLQVGYLYGHIPDAVPLDLNELFTTHNGEPGRLVSQSAAEDVLGRLGLTREKAVVIYDEGFGPLAAQLAWILDYYGHPEVNILEGGWEAWEQAGGEISVEVAVPEPKQYKAEPEGSRLATVEWVAAHLHNSDILLLDARTEAEFNHGRLPDAVNMPYDAVLDDVDPPRLKPRDELKGMLAEIGATPDKEIVVYCEMGARSAHSYVVLRWLGYPHVRNYEGSWAEWSRRMDLPVEGQREAAVQAGCVQDNVCGSMAAPDVSSERDSLSHGEILRYSRHLLMPEVGLQGQKKLKAASVLVIGTGGLGSPVAMYLAAAGVGRIGLVDYDVVDFTNLQRQIVHGAATLGERKVLSARDRLLDINPDIEVEVFDEAFTSRSAMRIAESYDLIIDGTDNFPTRYLVNDVCVLTGKPNVYGSIFRFEGQASVFWSERGPCYRCLFPEPPPPGLVPSCAEGGVFGVLPGTIGTLQATEALKLILGIGEPLIGRLLVYDALAMSFEEVRLMKNPQCRICSDQPEIVELIDYEEFCGVPGHDRDDGNLADEWEIEPRELAERLDSGEHFRLVDVREPHELEISSIQGAELIPLGSLAARMHELDSAEEILLFCKAGTRSARALELLLGAGFRKLKNLRGGINAWAHEVDPSLPIY